MSGLIESVEMVSDGLVIRFRDGLLTYYPGDYLRAQSGFGPNLVLLADDPSTDSQLPTRANLLARLMN